MESKTKHVEYPRPDGLLYRYKPLGKNNNSRGKNLDLDYIINEIETGDVYISRAIDLNDPFETRYKPDSIDDNDYNYHDLLQIVEKKSKEPSFYAVAADMITSKIKGSHINFSDFINITYDSFTKVCRKNGKYKDLTIDKYKRILKDELQKKRPSYISDILVASFSETYKSIPMWAYYANDYKGVCLEYDFSKVTAQIGTSILDNMFKVSYSSKMPKNKYTLYSPTVKSLEWSHEQEWRLIAFKDSQNIIRKNNKYFINVPYLKKVILGTNIKALDAIKIEKAVNKINSIRNINKKIYIEKIEADTKEYKLKSIKKNFSYNN